MELNEAVRRIDCFLRGLESFDLLSPQIEEAWNVVLVEVVKKIVRET